MKHLLPLVAVLSLGGCQGPDQYIVTRCETERSTYNSPKGCTCFRDNIKKTLPGKTYEAVAMSALGKTEHWKSHVASLKPDKRMQYATSIVNAAMTCQVMPWEELGELLTQPGL